MSQSAWTVGYREARAHALLAAIVLWTGAAIVTFGSTGHRNLADHLKGEDFVQIYTLVHAAFEGEFPTPARRQAFYDRQVQLVPASAGDHYLPVYPPTAAVIFRPLAALSYGQALALWTLVTIFGYAFVVRGAWRPVRSALPDTGFVVRAAAVFPPFYLLVLHGQTTLLPLLAFFLCWMALRARRPMMAGVALGLLTVKPQFGLVIAPALLFAGNWSVLLGLLMSFAAQIAAVIWMIGAQAISAYARTIADMPEIEPLLEPGGWRMHSIRTLTRLAPHPVGDLLWVAASTWILVAAIRVWRGPAPLGPRLGIVLLATVLVNPHLFGYDAVILVLPIIWLGAWLEEIRSPGRTTFWQSVYLLSVLLLVPTALFMPVQLSVVVMLWLFWRMARAIRADPASQASVPQ